jgi:hypothetical protein
MTTIAAYSLVRASAEKRERPSVHAVEKIKPQANFNGEYANDREPKSWVCLPREPKKTFQSGTIDDGSYWDGPRLTSEFAAQVLGQALADRAPNASAHAAYLRTARVARPLLDKNV